jgi:hypothetical protein
MSESDRFRPGWSGVFIGAMIGFTLGSVIRGYLSADDAKSAAVRRGHAHWVAEPGIYGAKPPMRFEWLPACAGEEGK